ncbi:MAG: Tol-Pal system beta propeller repeat protein TolB [Rickettsiales bacterium]|jgi:TolB protein|nr:Tol-Pal system beta propeller repeat protein TolB [Rickettsiales bacterium]
MLKKIILMIALVVMPFVARAELKVDIVAGNLSPLPIAIQKIESKQTKVAEELRGVIERDLKSTGLFRIIKSAAHPTFTKMGEMPVFTDWAAIRAQVMVQSKLTTTADGKYKLEFYVWDIAGKEQIEAQTLVAPKKSVRRLAHIMADAIYERLTGESGYFDTQIVLTTETGDIGNREKRLAIMDSDGYGFRYISDGKNMVMSPHFSPNMQTIVFLSYRDDVPMVWTLNMNTGAQRRLGQFGGMTFAPRFSPDGARVALTLAKGNQTNLYEFDMNTNKLRQLTFGGSINTSPSYSPDGKYLAFNSDRSGSQQIHLMNLSDLSEKRITFGAGRYATPAFSPDGKYIAFTKIADDTFFVGIMSPKGKNEKILTGGWFMEAPSWAPGSRRVVYYETEKTSDTQRHSHIRSIDITGQNVYDIELPNGVNGMEPTWSPKLP